MPYSDDMIAVRSTRIRMLRGGEGPPLIFLHGASGHVGWLPFLDRLSESFDVLAPEHPGFGSSDDPPWLDQTCDLAYFYLDLIEALKLDRVHLMGTSLGGWTAAELAIRNTSKLASLTLVCAVGITADSGPMDDIFRMSAEDNARRFYFDPERVKRRLDALAAADVRVVAKNRSTVVRLGYPRFFNSDLAKWLHRIDIPTLLLWGENDGLVPPRFGQAYRKLIPNSELVVIPRAGHAPFEEQPDAFLDAIRRVSDFPRIHRPVNRQAAGLGRESQGKLTAHLILCAGRGTKLGLRMFPEQSIKTGNSVMPYSRPIRRFYLTAPKVVTFAISAVLALLALLAVYGHFPQFHGINGFLILLIAYLILLAGTLLRGV